MRPDRSTRLFLRYRSRGDAAALGRVFDDTAPALMQLALRLAARTADAEDLVQSTWLTALERAQTFDGSRPLLPWLIGILTHHVQNARRRARELPAAVEARIDHADPAHLAQQDEVRRAVIQAVLDLPSPYREALLLNLRTDQTSSEIAEQLERSPGAVRMQIHRGLQLLRRMLPRTLLGVGVFTLAERRALAAVRAQVLGHAASPIAQATLVGGGLLVGKKIAALAAALMVVVAGVWMVESRWDERAAPPAPAAPVVAAAAAPEVKAADSPARAPVISPPGPASTLASVERTFALTGRVLDAQSGEPLAGALVHVEVLPVHSLAGEATSDAQGRFRLAGLEEFGTWSIVVSEKRHACFECQLQAGVDRLDPDPQDPWTLPLGDVRLISGTRLRGRVLDLQDRPVPDASLFLTPYRRCWGDCYLARARAAGTTDSGGAFTIEHVEPSGEERHALFALTADALGVEQVQVLQGREHIDDLVIRLAPSAAISVQVRDQEGRPCEAAGVVAEARMNGLRELSLTRVETDRGITWMPSPPSHQVDLGAHALVRALFSSISGADGTARLTHLPLTGRGCYDLVIRKDGCDPAFVDDLKLAPGEQRTVPVTLHPKRERAIHGLVRGPGGAPLPAVRFTAQSRERLDHVSFGASTDASGRFRIAVPSELHSFEVRVSSDAWTMPPREVLFEDEQLELELTLDVQRTTPISGRIVDQDGNPVPFAFVGVLLPGEQHMNSMWRGEADGRFTLKSATAGPQVVQVRLPWPPNQWVNDTPSWTLDGGARDVVLTVERAAARVGILRAEIVAAVTGEPLEPGDVQLVGVAFDGEPPPRLAPEKIDVAVGSVVAHGLAPGEWRMTFEVAGRGRQVSMFSIEPNERDAKVRVEVPAPGVIRGHVRLAEGGALPERARISLTAELPSSGNARAVESRYLATVPVGDDGAFEIRELAPQRLTLEIQKLGLLGKVAVDVPSGRTVDVVLEVRRGGIARTRGAEKLPTGNSSLFVAAADGDWRCVQSLTSMKGAELCVTFPPGSTRWRFAWRAEGKGEPTTDDPPLAEGKIDVEPGSEHVLEIR